MEFECKCGRLVHFSLNDLDDPPTHPMCFACWQAMPRYCPVCDLPVDPAHDGRVPPHRSAHGYPCRGEALNPAELPAALKYGGETR